MSAKANHTVQSDFTSKFIIHGNYDRGITLSDRKVRATTIFPKQKEVWLDDLKFLPRELELAIQNLDEAQLLTPYRDGGWTIQQLVHHIADSHINAYVRFKLGLTEDNPTIRPYEEKEWAKLDDVRMIPIEVSITLLHALHRRLVATVKDLSDTQWKRTVFHPEHKKEMTIWDLLGMYAWHGKHHVKHITALRERNGW